MKRTITLLILLLCVQLIIFTGSHVYAQCTPMTAEECPDPENNGEICPDSLAEGFINQLYSQVATILAPLTDTNGIPLHHITLKSVDNLPPGLAWESNAPNNEFMAGNYYCILMEGTPTEDGTFPLKIVVDIYVNVLGFPILAATVTDSTSLAIDIIDNTGLPERAVNGLSLKGNYPNPFQSWTSIKFFLDRPGPVKLEIFSIHGQRVDGQEIMAIRGEQFIHYHGGHLPQGTYLYTLRSGAAAAQGILIRHSH